MSRAIRAIGWTSLCCTLAALAFVIVTPDQPARAADEKAPAQPPKIRIGIYESRAIAVAYASSEYNSQYISKLMEQAKQAEAAGEQQHLKTIREEGEKHQRNLHRQGFGNAPVDDLLKHIADSLPDVAKKANVVAITRSTIYTDPSVEIVDVTDDLVAQFKPKEGVLRIIKDLRSKPPIDMDEVEKHHDH